MSVISTLQCQSLNGYDDDKFQILQCSIPMTLIGQNRTGWHGHVSCRFSAGLSGKWPLIPNGVVDDNDCTALSPGNYYMISYVRENIQIRKTYNNSQICDDN